MRLGASRAYNGPAAGDPLALPLATPAQVAGLFTFVNYVTVPNAWTYGGVAMGLNPSAGGGGTLYTTNAPGASVGALQLPSLAAIRAGGASTSVAIAPVSLPNQGIGTGIGNLDVVGTLPDPVTGRVIVTETGAYDVAGGTTAVMVSAAPDFSSYGTGCAIDSSYYGSGVYPRHYAGCMSLTPAIWQPYFGRAFVAPGPGGVNGIEYLCWGDGFVGFEPANVSQVGGVEVPVNDFVMWPPGQEPPYWGVSSMCTRPNIVGSISGTTLTITAVTIPSIAPSWGTNSYVMCAGVTTAGACVVTGPLAVNADGTGTYSLGASFSVPQGPMFITNTTPAICPGCTGATCIGGDDLASLYEGPPGCAFFVPGTRTIATIRVHQYGPHYGSPEAGTCPSACDPGASSTNDPRRVQVDLADAKAIYLNITGGGAPNAVTPYGWAPFPNWNGVWGTCPGQQANAMGKPGWAVYDWLNQLLYATVPTSGGHFQIGVWAVNTVQ